MTNTRKVDLDKGFENEDYLYDIRQNLINKLAVRASDNKKKIDEAYPLAKQAFTHFDLPDPDEKIVTFHSDSGEFPLDLKPLIPDVVIPDFVYPIQDENGRPYSDVKNLKIGEGIQVAERNQGSGSTLELTVPSPWAKIGSGNWNPVKNFTILDPNNKAKIDNNTLTIVVPKDYGQLQGQIAEGADNPVSKIKVTGNIDNTSIADGLLTINIPTGGGTVTSEGYFRGFFETLGDVESNVKDPVPGKSFVFVKDHLLPNNKYYTPYFFVNKSWTEVPIDPAITFTRYNEVQPQGVFSIKSDPRITIDANGQLDLGGLATDEAKLNFHGFYQTQAELEAAVPRPIQDKSFAYVKHPSGAWVGKTYRQTGTGVGWQLVVPIGALSLVESPAEISASAPIYGIARNDDWVMSSDGILSLKDKEAELKFEVTKPGSTELLSGDFKTIQFRNSRSNVFYTEASKKLFIEHPQQVISYDGTFEQDHNEDIYKGNIFYDETSRCWMGWGTPEAAGGVDVKWTRIAHPKMSDEVKDLSKRWPTKAPYITPGVIGDAAGWEYNGWSYVKKDDQNLPADFRERCGGYISTVIQNVENDTPRPQERLQVCYADEDGGHCYVRRWNRSATGGDYGWRAWNKISMSQKDIDAHNTDPNAHKDLLKFYKVATIDLTVKDLKAKHGVFFEEDLLLLADSHGSVPVGSQYTVIPYDGSFKFSGRLEIDGWGTTSTFDKSQALVYVYRTRGSVSEIIGEFSYSHDDHTKPYPPLKWATGAIVLKYGDKIHFEYKSFGTDPTIRHPNLAFVPIRTYFVIEDARISVGSRIAKTFERTLGSTNTQKTVGVNVHHASGTSGAIRVYGVDLASQVNMTHIKG